MARPMAMLARIAAPLVWLLDTSSGLLIRLLRVRGGGQSLVTADELHMIFAEATRSGVIDAEQRQILAGVVRLAARPVREMMTPRPEIDWIEVHADETEICRYIKDNPHSPLQISTGSAEQLYADARGSVVTLGQFE